MQEEVKLPVLPQEIVDAHHHFLDTGNQTFQSFLASLVPNETYLPADYARDVVSPLKQCGVSFHSSVHVECLPDDGEREVVWVDGLSSDHCCTVHAIVGSCNLSLDTAEQEILAMKRQSTMFRGVRWILDYDGPFNPDSPSNATHVGTTRHKLGNEDFLRGSDVSESANLFSAGFSLLAKHHLSFDLQCAPVQLSAAYDLCKRHPDVSVVIDHLGKLRLFKDPMSTALDLDEAALNSWRANLKAMATLPNVYIKLSMLGYAVPGWIRSPQKTELVRTIVREAISMFTPQRCMVALNWWKSSDLSDSDGLSLEGPTAVEFVTAIANFVSDFSTEDKHALFAGTAIRFYRITKK